MIIPLQDRGWSIMLYEYGWYLPNGTGLFGNYCGDIRLAASRDGVHYTRIELYQITIPRGERGNWDSGLLVVSDKAVIKDGTIYLYYAGCGEQWTSWPKQNRPSAPGLKQMTHRRACQMGLATLDLDRFTCLTTCDGQTFGHAVTAPITVCNAGQVKLTINVGDTVQDRIWIEVDILNAANNEPIAGYADEACVALDEDGQAVTAIWKAHQTLADVGCKKIRLRFRLYGNAKLYSFYFDEM